MSNIRQNICNLAPLYNSHRLDCLFFDIKIRKIIEFFNITNILATCKSSFQVGNCIFSLCFSPLVITKLTLNYMAPICEAMLFLLSNLETRRRVASQQEYEINQVDMIISQVDITKRYVPKPNHNP